jgi:hypothetical protein
MNDSTAGAVGSEGEGASCPCVRESSDTDNDVIPAENSDSIYINFFCETLHKKIELYFDTAFSSNDNSIANTSSAPNTSIRDDILDLLRRNCESFPA